MIAEEAATAFSTKGHPQRGYGGGSFGTMLHGDGIMEAVVMHRKAMGQAGAPDVARAPTRSGSVASTPARFPTCGRRRSATASRASKTQWHASGCCDFTHSAVTP